MTDLRVVRDIATLTIDPARRTPLLVRGDLDLATAGAILADLALDRRITVDEGLLVVLDDAPTGDRAVDEILTSLPTSPSRSAADWVWQLATPAHQIRTEQVEAAVRAGALTEEKRRFRSRRWRPVPGGPVELRAHEIERAVTVASTRVDPATAASISILDAAGCLARRFPAARADLVAAVVDQAASARGSDAAVAAAIREVTTVALTNLLVSTAATTAPH